MYHAIVERKLRRAFEALNHGDHGPVLAAFSPQAEHVFHGEHALAGARHGIHNIEPWYARLKAVLPDLHFDIDSVLVRGTPWNTAALVEWRDHFHLRDGNRGSNQGVHALRLKWGRVTSLRVYCDTQVLAQMLRRQCELGVPEAGLAPLGDAPVQAGTLVAALG